MSKPSSESPIDDLTFDVITVPACLGAAARRVDPASLKRCRQC
jgi:hypothetical protein